MMQAMAAALIIGTFVSALCQCQQTYTVSMIGKRQCLHTYCKSFTYNSLTNDFFINNYHYCRKNNYNKDTYHS